MSTTHTPPLVLRYARTDRSRTAEARALTIARRQRRAEIRRNGGR